MGKGMWFWGGGRPVCSGPPGWVHSDTAYSGLGEGKPVQGLLRDQTGHLPPVQVRADGSFPRCHFLTRGLRGSLTWDGKVGPCLC